MPSPSSAAVVAGPAAGSAAGAAAPAAAAAAPAAAATAYDDGTDAETARCPGGRVDGAGGGGAAKRHLAGHVCPAVAQPICSLLFAICH